MYDSIWNAVVAVAAARHARSLLQAGSQRFPTYLGFSNGSVNQAYGMGEGRMLRCSRKANTQRAPRTGRFALVVWRDSQWRVRMSIAAVNVLVQGHYLLIRIILVLFGFTLSSSLC